MVKVTVIIPVYNAEKYLQRCIDTIVNQTLKEIEIICINDCSYDNSLNIIMEYAKQDSRIIIVNNKKNMGAGYSRNRGIHLAKGEYLSILDADDFFDLNLLQEVYGKCVESNTDIGVYDFAKYDNKTENISRYSLAVFFEKQLNDNKLNFDIVKKYIFQIIPCCAWNKMIKKEFVLDKGIEFQNLNNANDVFFSNMLLVQSSKIIFIKTIEPLLYYRVNLQNQIINNRDKDIKCIWKALYAMYEYLIKQKQLTDYHQSFNSYAIENLVYVLNNISSCNKKKLCEFLRIEGFEKLGMNNSLEDDFLSQSFYKQYRYIYQGRMKENNSNEINRIFYTENRKTAKLFTQLKIWEWRCGLWGMGLLGKNFLEVCKEYDYHLSCLIDGDNSKIGDEVENYVIESIQMVQERIDAIIITNSYYGKNILEKTRNINSHIKIIDIGMYYRFDLEITECIY